VAQLKEPLWFRTFLLPKPNEESRRADSNRLPLSKLVKHLLGHASMIMTVDHYSH
jgi:hypothetical protein